MKFQALREAVLAANLRIAETGLAPLTWGNASGCDREAGILIIKPSGVPYDQLHAQNMVAVSLERGEVLDNTLRPSSDLPTHLHLYRSFKSLGGIVHTHSRYATSWAQAAREIPCMGTTHADHFYGSVPLCRPLTEEEINGEYELNTGRVIEEYFLESGLNPAEVPGVLVPCHGPFIWGSSPSAAISNAQALEEIAAMAKHTLDLAETFNPVPQYLLDRHFLRKHGSNAYYGQEPI